MTDSNFPLLIEPQLLEKSLGSNNLLIIDLSKPENYARLHIPGAIHLDYAQIVSCSKPVMGMLPDSNTLQSLFSACGIGPDTHVVAYDDEGGGRACRLLWTLDACGHTRYSLLNGGLHAWANEGHPHENTPASATPATFRMENNTAPVATRDYIREHLGDPHCCLLDVRSPDEYNGVKKLAERAGHIPGAVNLEWTRAIDTTRNLRLQADEELTRLFAGVRATPDRQVIAYCQSHHRSAHTWLVLKYLGYPEVKGYPGSWSDWGNQAELPVE